MDFHRSDAKSISPDFAACFGIHIYALSSGDGSVRQGANRRQRRVSSMIWEHVNPYGRFELDMTTRLPLK